MTRLSIDLLNSSKFQQKRSFARDQLINLKIKDVYYNMLNKTIIKESLKQEHSNKFFTHYDAIEKWLDITNTEYFCKINYQSFLSHMADLAQECEVIYFGIALLDDKFQKSDLKKIRSTFISFFSIYQIQIDFRFKTKFGFKRSYLAPNVNENNNNK